MTDIELKQYIGNKLKQYREAANLSRLQVAQVLNSSKSHINQIELGYAMPSVITLKKYCKLYDIKSSDLLPF